ncbi:hypothetical protein G6F50_015655 [Rhizopus delemar]|uniref:Uncharacterized protein n=1 Tax=Rhizopus delemar TaxID=936053 RepID=A0A9P6XWT7_9FUNG|nr:hypothetical protein G6F50_015655 [Rhizopus delemar]
MQLQLHLGADRTCRHFADRVLLGVAGHVQMAQLGRLVGGGAHADPARQHERRQEAQAEHADQAIVVLAALAQAHVQRRIDRHHAVGHAPGQQGQVALADAGAVVFTQQRLQLAQRRALLGHDQQARCVAIQPVDQLQGLPRAQRTQGLDGAETDAAATVAGHAAGA